MAVSEAELDAMRARADHLRKEIRAFRTEGVGARLEADRDAQAEALQAEIKRLETETIDAAKSGGGSVEDALAAMDRAEKLQQMMTPTKKEEAESEDDRTDGEQPTDPPGDVTPTEVLAPADRPVVGENAEGDR